MSISNLSSDVCTVDIGEPYTNRSVGAVLLEIGASGGDVVFGQNALDPLQHAIVDFYRGLVRGDLHGGRLAEEIRQRIKYADQQRGEYGQVFPEWITVHYRPSNMCGKKTFPAQGAGVGCGL